MQRNSRIEPQKLHRYLSGNSLCAWLCCLFTSALAVTSVIRIVEESARQNWFFGIALFDMVRLISVVADAFVGCVRYSDVYETSYATAIALCWKECCIATTRKLRVQSQRWHRHSSSGTERNRTVLSVMHWVVLECSVFTVSIFQNTDREHDAVQSDKKMFVNSL